MRRKKQTTAGSKSARKARPARRAQSATRQAPSKTAPSRTGAVRKAAARRSGPATKAAKKAGGRARATAVKPSRKSTKTAATGAARKTAVKTAGTKTAAKKGAKAKPRKDRPTPEAQPIEIEVREPAPVPQVAADSPAHVPEPAAIGPSDSAPCGVEAGRPQAGSERRGGAEIADSSEAAHRPNKLVPTNAVHTTNRRLKRGNRQSRVFVALAAAALFALLILSDREQPPDLSPLEQRASSGLADVGTDTAAAAGGPAKAAARATRPPRIADPVQADPNRRPQVAVAPTPLVRFDRLNATQITEMERMLARLDLHPSPPDGTLDDQTESAIRLYQQIAGLPVDGQASQSLLDDMREVVRILDKSE